MVARILKLDGKKGNHHAQKKSAGKTITRKSEGQEPMAESIGMDALRGAGVRRHLGAGGRKKRAGGGD